MSKLGFWDEPDGPWDRLTLGPFQMPGAWSVSAECARDIDMKKSKGKDGAHIKDQGYQPASITLRGTFWEREQWEKLQEILPQIHPRKKGGERGSMRVVHPALAIMGVHKLYPRKISAPTVGAQGLEISIECMEWTAAPKAVKKKLTDEDKREQQRLANAGVGNFGPLEQGGLETGTRIHLGGAGEGGNFYTGYRVSPAEAAAATKQWMEEKEKVAAKTAADKKNADVAALMPPERKPVWYRVGSLFK